MNKTTQTNMLNCVSLVKWNLNQVSCTPGAEWLVKSEEVIFEDELHLLFSIRIEPINDTDYATPIDYIGLAFLFDKLTRNYCIMMGENDFRKINPGELYSAMYRTARCRFNPEHAAQRLDS